MPEGFHITGQIRYADERLAAGVAIQAFDKDLPSWERRTGSGPQELGSTITDQEGRFTINYTEERFRRGEASSNGLRRSRRAGPDVVFRIFNPQGQELWIVGITANDIELPPPQILFNAPAETHIFIIVEPRDEVADSEYEQLLAQLSPVLEDVPLAELTGEDVAFLVGDTGRERRHIEYIRGAAQLSRDTGVPTEAFYGWARHDPLLPQEWERLLDVPDGDARRAGLTAILRRLSEVDDAELRIALQRQIEQRIIPARIREQIEDIIRQLKQRGRKMRQMMAQLLTKETGEALPGCGVSTFDLDASEEDLGQSVTDIRGLFSFACFVRRGTPRDAPRRFLFRVRMPSGEPQPEPVTITIASDAPSPVAIEITLPVPEQPSMAQLRQEGQLELPDEVLENLKGRGIVTLADIRRQGGLRRLADLPPQADAALIGKLEALADLDRLTPDLKVSKALIEKGYASVTAVADSPRADFVTSVHEQVHEFKAAQLHFAARAETQVLKHMLEGALAENATGFPVGISELMQNNVLSSH